MHIVFTCVLDSLTHDKFGELSQVTCSCTVRTTSTMKGIERNRVSHPGASVNIFLAFFQEHEQSQIGKYF